MMVRRSIAKAVEKNEADAAVCGEEPIATRVPVFHAGRRHSSIC